MKATWYFDFISPYSYLQALELPRVGATLELEYRPILFAALLDHWGQLGPAEIGPKREFTYRQVCWLARKRRVELTMPEAHPFNPLPLLRLALHSGCRYETIMRLFRFVWVEGHTPQNGAAWQALTRELGVTDADITRAEIKDALRLNTEQALASGVFGVPTLVIGGRAFWGNDATQMALDFASDPAPFERDDAALRKLPAGAVRRASRRPVV